MVFIVISLVLISIFLMLFLQQRSVLKKIQQELSQEYAKSIQFEQKFESSKEEFRKNKEELERKKNELQDLKESSKKKMRRLMESDVNNRHNEDNMNDRILDDSNKTILALENVIETLKNDHENEKNSLVENIKKDFHALEENLRNEINKLQEELKKHKKGAKLEGYKIDFSLLPNDVATEVVRIIKKSQQDERLNGINRAKLLLAQEKFATLQKRYFEVCREYAIVMGNPNSSNTEEIISHNNINVDDSLGNVKDPQEDDL